MSGPSLSPRRGAAPLSGVRVLDLSALTPGPFATTMLAELGATVVKVERTGSGDPLRRMLPMTFEMLGRGKLSMTADLKDPADRDALLRLAEDADVFVEGFRPGVVDRLGVGYAQVRQRSPRIIYLSLSSYGQSGPLAHIAGHDLNFVGRAGGLAVGGRVDDPPRYGTYQVADLAASAYLVIAVLAALRTERADACWLDLSLMGAALGFTQLAAAEAAEVDAAAATEAQHPTSSGRGKRGTDQRPANGVFPAGDDTALTVCAVEDHFWAQMCEVMGMEDMAGRLDLATYAQRLEHADEINAEVVARLAARPAGEWLHALEAAGVPAGPVHTPAEAREDGALLGSCPPLEPASFAVPLPVLGLPLIGLGPCPELGEHDEQLRATGWVGATAMQAGESR